MKTDASYTKRKSAADLAIQSLRQWTQQQLNNIKKTQTLPLCWESSDGSFIVGEYRVKKLAERCWQTTNQHNDPIHIFISKATAFFYCLCTQAGHINLAEKILKYDAELGLLESDAEFFQRSIIKAKNRHDDFKLQLWRSRLTQNLALQKRSRGLLEKTVRSAKYLKLWEQLP